MEAASTHPLLPALPVTDVDMVGVDPALAPEQQDHPEKGQQMREAQQPLGRQVPLELVQHSGDQDGDPVQARASDPFPRQMQQLRDAPVYFLGHREV